MTLVTVKGHVEPRLSTPPLRELTPESSYGFAVIEFANKVLNEPLLEWQEKLVIRIGELLDDGTPRFKKVLILVARQNGKTHFVKVLSLYWLLVDRVELMAGTSATLKHAKEAWRKSIQVMENSPLLKPLIAKVRVDNTEPHLMIAGGGRYFPSAANDGSIRGFTLDRLIVDELRRHKNYDAWDASVYTVRTKPYSQIICISNAGDAESVVLNDLRQSALDYIDSEGLIGDGSLGLFEWSAEDHADPMDMNNWAAANPSLNVINPQTGFRVLKAEDVQADAIRAVATGGLALTGFLTEGLCMNVPAMDAAIDAAKWDKCAVSAGLDTVASATVWGFDVNRANTHATLVAAVTNDDGITHIQVIFEWRAEQMQNVIEDLIRLLNEHRPRSLGWLPIGPAATYAATLKEKSGSRLAHGVVIQELTGEVTDAVMGFANDVQAERIRHKSDPLLNDHVKGASRLWSGDRWKFSRKGKGSVDAAYAASVAWLLASNLPPMPDFEIYSIKSNRERS